MVNNTLCEIVGYSKEELLQRSLREITHPEDTALDANEVKRLLAGETQAFSVEKRCIRKDNACVWTKKTVSLARDESGQPRYFILIIENINQRKELDRQLHLAHAEMERTIESRSQALRQETADRKRAESDRNSFFDLSTELVAIFSYDGFLKAANPALKKCLGYSDEILTTKRFIEFIHPDDVEESLAAGREFRQTGLFRGLENRYICADGRVVVLSWSVTGSPEHDCIYTVARDVTELRKKEQQLAEQKSRVAANLKVQSLSRIASGMAHEINNPLTVIYGQTSSLKKIAHTSPIEKSKLLAVAVSMENMCERIIRLINHLRMLSRDATNDPFELYSLQTLVENTLSFCRERMKHHDIELQVDPIAAEYAIFCRPTQMTQALLNLLDNSFDAVKQSAIKKIAIKLIIEPQQIGLSVIDSGPGIAPELAAELFTPFFSTKGFSNSGLGLSTTKAIVDDHNGIIYLDTTQPHTCFTFLLPKIT